jgi:hypothetical protein
VDGRSHLIFILYQVVMVLAYTFMHGSEYHYILLALILVGSLLIFIKFHFNTPFYNDFISQLWSSLCAINLWTAIMVCFAKVILIQKSNSVSLYEALKSKNLKFMENSLFQGSIIAWIIGIPFIILIVITNRDHRLDLLLLNVNKISDGEELMNQIRFLLKLISWQGFINISFNCC